MTSQLLRLWWVIINGILIAETLNKNRIFLAFFTTYVWVILYATRTRWTRDLGIRQDHALMGWPRRPVNWTYGWMVGRSVQAFHRAKGQRFFFYPFLFVSVGKFALLELEKMTDQ
jgi:hypothetical protein